MKNNQKVVWALDQDKNTLIIGVSRQAWEYMKDGMTHTLDLRRFGFPHQIILFGGKDNESIKKIFVRPDTIDASGEDVSIQPDGPESN